MTYALHTLAPDAPGIRRGSQIRMGASVIRAANDISESDRAAILALPVGACYHVETLSSGRIITSLCLERVS